jgi:hypothetical protein
MVAVAGAAGWGEREKRERETIGAKQIMHAVDTTTVMHYVPVITAAPLSLLKMRGRKKRKDINSHPWHAVHRRTGRAEP